jgi:UDP-N-acetylglucosamine transferase subunit ALG13
VIFVTVGTQLPFDRLVAAVDDWAVSRGTRDVFAQVGPSRFTPRTIQTSEFISPEECRWRMRDATAIVAHAGMGTILTALELGKPLLVMPRQAAYGEHRNDHQMSTARRFGQLGRVSVVFDETDLPRELDKLGVVSANDRISPFASDRLIGALRAFIDGDEQAA